MLLTGCLPLFAQAQESSNHRVKELPVEDTLRLDSLSIIPHSVSISVNGNEIDSSTYTIIPQSALLIWKNKPTDKTATVRYRVFPYDLTAEKQHKDAANIEPDAYGNFNPFAVTFKPDEHSILDLQGLSKRGSISRGVMFGNNQDLSVNSTLNLQLGGKIAENINIKAAITDNNIPIQPEGNTQQLQEFDQVYIQLFDDAERWRLTAGDFQLRTPKSFFMKYFKRAQGASFETGFKTGKKATEDNHRVKASAALSKGKFNRMIIQGVEGNQGPYRLRGAENEQFIIVLSGTERVYIDGELLVRGQENDYVIDYNTAELTFTARRLITKDKRLVVEYQYSVFNFRRSLIQFSEEYDGKKLKLNFNIYAEQDNKTRPLQWQIDQHPERVSLLQNIGDSLQDAIAYNIDSVPFGDDIVLYQMVDSLGYDSVFVFSVNPDSAHYQLGFSDVGVGNGNYVQLQSVANGKVFQWVAPDTVGNQITPNGQFEPVILLITPKAQQMASLGGSYQLSKASRINFEAAVTNYDQNTFSSRDAGDNVGHAFLVAMENKIPLSKKERPWNLIANARYERVDRYFEQVERFRSVEFDRDWNIRQLTLAGTQHVPGAALGLEQQSTGKVLAEFNSFISETEFDGYQGKLLADINKKGFKLNSASSYMQAESNIKNSLFIRNKSRISQNIKWLQVGARNDFEQNQFFDPTTDTLALGSYEFMEWQVFVNNGDTTRNRFELFYGQRTDKALRNDALGLATYGENVGFSFDLMKNPNSILRGKATHRQLDIRDATITTQKPDETILGRLEYGFKLWKGTISSTSFFEVGSGLENKKEFSYIEVQPGQGVYSWTDYNDNSIKELDEFEVAAFVDQADYIRVWTPTDEYVKVFTNQLNQLLHIRPARVWRSKKGMLKFLSRFSDQVAYRIERKTNEGDYETAYNPFLQSISDTTLITLNNSFRNTLFFNKSDPHFGVDVNYQDIRNKTLLTNGFDSRTNIFWSGNIRWNVTRQFLLNLAGKEGQKTSQQEFFTSREYDIEYYELEPRLTWQPGTRFRLSVFFTYAEKLNDSEFLEKAIMRKLGTDVKFMQVGKGSLLANVNYILFSYGHPTSTSLAFQMLEGLQPGQNATWAVSYQRTLGNNLQLTLNYNGRQSEASAKIVHAGGVQVRAFF